MTETIPTRPFDEMEALAWLRSQPEGVVTTSAAELGRRWGWNRMRAGRRLKAWEKAGLIHRNAEAIIATTPVTSTVTDVAPTDAKAVSVTLMPETTSRGVP
jgi:long-subunit acyl-CoA synthetase (AMP-forming)